MHLIIHWFISLIQIKTFLMRKARYLETNSVMNFVRSVVMFSLGDIFFKINKMSLAKLYF